MNADLSKNCEESGERLNIVPFAVTLAKNGITLTRDKTTILQVNVGLLCNQVCRHCHLEAGPDRKEVMSRKTALEVATFAQKWPFEMIDITGGAPELNPNIIEIILTFSGIAPKIIMRSNLTCLAERSNLLDVLVSCKVSIVASLPSLNREQLESQRGDGTFEKSIEVLRNLNSMGYGEKGSELQLDLVSNPAGAFLPPPQVQAEKKFRDDLERKWGIKFNRLFTFANVPLGRFRLWLKKSGNYEKYMQKLASSFNPCAVQAVMCRNLISISWDGYLYDCDFNQAAGVPATFHKIHVSKLDGPPPAGTRITVSDHCYACTAGAGFT